MCVVIQAGVIERPVAFTVTPSDGTAKGNLDIANSRNSIPTDSNLNVTVATTCMAKYEDYVLEYYNGA